MAAPFVKFNLPYQWGLMSGCRAIGRDPDGLAFSRGSLDLAAAASFVIAALTGGLSGIIFGTPRGYVQVP